MALRPPSTIQGTGDLEPHSIDAAGAVACAPAANRLGGRHGFGGRGRIDAAGAVVGRIIEAGVGS